MSITAWPLKCLALTRSLESPLRPTVRRNPCFTRTADQQECHEDLDANTALHDWYVMNPLPDKRRCVNDVDRSRLGRMLVGAEPCVWGNRRSRSNLEVILEQS